MLHRAALVACALVMTGFLHYFSLFYFVFHHIVQKANQLTTSAGCPVDSKTSTMTVGPRGPIVLQDQVFLDDMAHFDRERIPERVVHAKGAGRNQLANKTVFSKWKKRS